MGLVPRAVVVTRPTELEELLLRHGTRAQARFVLERRGLTLAEVDDRHRAVRAAVAAVTAAIPLEWRRAAVRRADLDRFIFEPEDIVVAVGQDGLVANVAKYAGERPVIGVNPGIYDGVLVRHRPEQAGALLRAAAAGEVRVEERTLVEATTSDGQRLLALNEVFLGHRSHQSARYTLSFAGRRERHSSSGLITATGTGSTGWALSITRQRRGEIALPAPSERALVFLVREAWPSRATGATLTEGRIVEGAAASAAAAAASPTAAPALAAPAPLAVAPALEVTSEMNEGGVLFGDGIEDDRIELPYGLTVTLRVAPGALRLVR